MGEKYTVLVVEDDRANAFLVQHLLASSQSCGFPYIFATEATNKFSVALARVQAGNGIDLIVLDLNLRGQTVGFEGFDKLTAMTDIPIVIVTGTIDLEDVARALQRGAQAVYLKPILNIPESTPHSFIHGVWSAIHRQKYVKALKPRQAETVESGLEPKPGLSKITVAGIITAIAAVIAGLVKLVELLKTK